MKTTSKTSIAIVAALSAAASSAWAQSVDSVGVIKIQIFQQSDASSVSLIPEAMLPFGVDVSVSGDDMNLLSPAPILSGPISVPEPTHNGGVLGLNEDQSEWQYGFPGFNSIGTETLAETDALFGEGVYTFNVAGNAVSLTLGPVDYPENAPAMSISGGAWDNGVYRVDAQSEITIQSSEFPEFETEVPSAVFLGVFGDTFGTESFAFSNSGESSIRSIVIPAGSLVPGCSYNAEVIHTIATDFQELTFGAPGAFGVAGYEKITELVITVDIDEQCDADLAEPFGVLDLSDIVAFVNAFTMFDPIADFDDSGVFDLSDITAFVSSFVAGCP